jgi:hypothetical protein
VTLLLPLLLHLGPPSPDARAVDGGGGGRAAAHRRRLPSGCSAQALGRCRSIMAITPSL